MSGRAGVVLRRRRATDVETVFGDIKSNWGFKRFTLRGLEKASLEWGLAALGHNMRKLHEAVSRGERCQAGDGAGVGSHPFFRPPMKRAETHSGFGSFHGRGF